MRRLVYSSRSILAALAVAGVLYALLWQQVGAPRGMIYHDRTRAVVYLFLGDLTAGLLVIAVAAGLVCGAIGGDGRLRSAAVRVAIASVAFGAVVFIMFSLSGAPPHIAGGGPHSQMSPAAAVPLFLLLVVASLLFGAIGSIPYAAAAVVAASVADSWSQRNRRLLVAVLPLAICVGVALPVAQGASVRSDVKRIARSARRAAPLVKRHLVDLPAGCQWWPVQPRALPEVPELRCDIRDASVSVRFSRTGALRSADVVLTAPRGAELSSRQAAMALMRDHGVREQLVSSIRRNKRGAWEASAGKYSVVLSEWHPDYD